MKLRFLQTVESSAPGYPFMAGQVITDLPRLSAEMRQWMRDGLAELVRDEEPIEAVAAPAPERAVVRKKRRA